MATDATGTPTSPDGIPTYNTAVDAPSGKGFNAAMAVIQTALSARVSSPVGIVTGEVPVYNGTNYVRSSVTPISISGLDTRVADKGTATQQNFLAANIGFGSASAPDTVVGRMTTNVFGSSNSALSTGPTNNLFSGAQQTGGFLSATGKLSTFNSAAFVAFETGLTTHTAAAFSINYLGLLSWGLGTGAADTTLIRSAAGVVKVSNAIREVRGTIAYTASMTPDASAGEWFLITVTNTTAFTINAPINPPGAGETQHLSIEIKNSSGGVMGAITWNAVYKGFSVTVPATGFSTAVTFRWNGTAWIGVGSTPAGQTY